MPEEPLEAMCRRVVCVLEEALRTLDGAKAAKAITTYHSADLSILRSRATLLADCARYAIFQAEELKRA